MIEQKRFSGVMDTDSSEAFISPSSHKYAMNGRFYGTPQGLQFENIKGTTLIPNSYLPTGTNECIGSFFDSLRQRIIWFNWNSNNRHGIYQYDIRTAVITPLIICFTNSAIDILEFSRDFPIVSVVMLYTNETDGDILHWVARNNRPMKLNINEALANTYGAAWQRDYLTVASDVQIIPPIVAYADDASVNNNLKNKLYMFRQRWAHRDYTKTTLSAYSKLASPFNPDDIANNTNEHKNNRLDVTINTGAADVTDIEVIGYASLPVGMSAPFLITTLNKAALGLADNVQYIFKFYNDSSYTNILVKEANELFDYIPRMANTMELLNGNVIIYGGILEGYNFGQTLDVSASVSLINYVSDQSSFVVSSVANSLIRSYPDFWEGDYYIFVSGLPRTGDVYAFNVSTDADSTYAFPGFTISYTVVPGDTMATVLAAIAALFNANLEFTANYPNPPIPFNTPPDGIEYVAQGALNGGSTSTGYIRLYTTYSPYKIYVDTVFTYSTTPVLDGVANSIYKDGCGYDFAFVYFDEFGVTDGVHTNASLVIGTPTNATLETTPHISQITININSRPPIWAKTFSIVRSPNLTVLNNVCGLGYNTKKDSTNKYVFIEIDSLLENTVNLPTYEFLEGDRVKLRYYHATGGGNTYINKDFPILDLVLSPVIDSVTYPGTFLKIPYDSSLSVFGTAAAYYVYVDMYTPAPKTSLTQTEFFEFGESYNIINPGTANRVHQGKTQDQIFGTQPAIFVLIRGDYYIKYTTYFINHNVSDIYSSQWFIDQNVSYLFPSRLTGNGRAFVVDKYARETYHPTRVRWGREYQQDTNINLTNRFYPDQYDDSARDKGDIQRMKSRGNILRVFFNRAVGQYGVYARFIKNNQGSTDLITTDDIITANNIQYYLGSFGMGDQYCGLISGTNQDYFSDPVRGYQLRLSNDGIIEISEKYYGKFYISSLLIPYNKTWLRSNGAKAKILGCYDFFEDQAMFLLQGGTNGSNTIPSLHFSFNENRNAYCSFYDFYPDWITSAQDILYSWINGQLWVHNNTASYCKFYGAQSDCYITLVFNINLLEKKTWESVTELANTIWSCPLIYSSVMSFGSQRQETNLVANDFQEFERQFQTAFLRDIWSVGGLINGDILKGEFLVIKFQKTSPTSLVYLSSVSVEYKDSPLTNK